MTADVVPLPVSSRPEVPILRAFAWINENGVNGAAATVEFGLGNGGGITFGAGGSGRTSSPSHPPFATYEVMLDGESPRFWRRYTDEIGIQFANVPPLLISHYVIRNGGVVWSDYRATRPLKAEDFLMPRLLLSPESLHLW